MRFVLREMQKKKKKKYQRTRNEKREKRNRQAGEKWVQTNKLTNYSVQTRQRKQRKPLVLRRDLIDGRVFPFVVNLTSLSVSPVSVSVSASSLCRMAFRPVQIVQIVQIVPIVARLVWIPASIHSNNHRDGGKGGNTRRQLPDPRPGKTRSQICRPKVEGVGR